LRIKALENLSILFTWDRCAVGSSFPDTNYILLLGFSLQLRLMSLNLYVEGIVSESALGRSTVDEKISELKASLLFLYRAYKDFEWHWENTQITSLRNIKQFVCGMEIDWEKCVLLGYYANCTIPLKPHNSPEERSSPLLRGGSQKSRMGKIVFSVR
jgi:hypothetical protein